MRRFCVLWIYLGGWVHTQGEGWNEDEGQLQLVIRVWQHPSQNTHQNKIKTKRFSVITVTRKLETKYDHDMTYESI